MLERLHTEIRLLREKFAKSRNFQKTDKDRIDSEMQRKETVGRDDKEVFLSASRWQDRKLMDKNYYDNRE